MNGKFRRWLSGLAVLAVPVTAVAAAPDVATELVFDLWHANDYTRSTRILRSDHDLMDLDLRDAQDRMAIKERVVVELLAGRSSLDAAIDRFVQVNGGRQAAMISLDGATDEEKAAYSISNTSRHDPRPTCRRSPRNSKPGSAGRTPKNYRRD